MKIDPTIGSMSLVGVVSTSVPVPFGNYFTFANGFRCVNMWAENLQYLVHEQYVNEYIEVDVYSVDESVWAVVVDKRLPKEFLNTCPCFTGYWSPPPGLMEFMVDRYGWEWPSD